MSIFSIIVDEGSDVIHVLIAQVFVREVLIVLLYNFPHFWNKLLPPRELLVPSQLLFCVQNRLFLLVQEQLVVIPAFVIGKSEVAILAAVLSCGMCLLGMSRLLVSPSEPANAFVADSSAGLLICL